METYSDELCRHLALLVDLHRQVLPGRRNGMPPRISTLALFLFRTCLLLARRRADFDIIHFGDMALYPIAWFHALIAPQRTRVMTVHGLDIVYARRPGFVPRIYARLLALARRCPRCIAHYVANSRNTARIAEEAGFRPVTAIPLGTSRPSQWTPTQPAQPPYLLFVGRVVPRKGVGWFVEHVMPRLPPDMRLLIAGKIWDHGEQGAISRAEQVEQLGFVPDDELNGIRKEALAVVMPNQPDRNGADVEGFGLAALEPPAVGVPVLASSIEGLTDAVNDGSTGFLLPHDEPLRWVESIQRIADWTAEERARFARTAQETVDTQYSWSRVADDTLAAYRMAIARRA